MSTLKPLKNFPKNNEVRLSMELLEVFYDLFNELFVSVFDQYCRPYTPYDKLTAETLSKIDSAIASCNYSIEGDYVYKAYIESTSAYLYFINKTHSLLDGNKRLSIASALIYLGVNKKWLSMNWKQLHDLAIYIAESNARKKNEILEELYDQLQNKIVDYIESESLATFSSNPSNIWFISSHSSGVRDTPTTLEKRLSRFWSDI